jgi:hypothetical protein
LSRTELATAQCLHFSLAQLSHIAIVEQDVAANLTLARRGDSLAAS